MLTTFPDDNFEVYCRHVFKDIQIFEREKNKALKSNIMHKCVREEKTDNESRYNIVACEKQLENYHSNITAFFML